MHQSLREKVEQQPKLPSTILQDINLVKGFQTGIRGGISSSTRVIHEPIFHCQCQLGVLDMSGLYVLSLCLYLCLPFSHASMDLQ